MGNSKAVIVLGMHRSGTSALTGVLRLLGVEVGGRLIAAVPGVNPKGFWENAEIVDLHDRVLAVLGSSWNDERELPERWWTRSEMEVFRDELSAIIDRDFPDSALWAVKDPRMCRLMPLWQPFLARSACTPTVVMILRNPREVAQSLYRRDGISTERACLLWLQHVLEAERWTRNYPRALVTYENLLNDWRSVIGEVSNQLALDLADSRGDAQARVEAFLEPELRHHAAALGPSSDLVSLVCQAYEACVSAGGSGNLEGALAPFADAAKAIFLPAIPWSSEIQVLRATMEQLRTTIATRDAQIETIESDRRAMQKEVVRIKGTVSWRITAPLRVSWNLLRRRAGAANAAE